MDILIRARAARINNILFFASFFIFDKPYNSAAKINYTFRHNFAYQTLTFNTSISYSLHKSNADDEKSDYAWDNVLNHQIGQLYSSLIIRTQKSDGVQTSLLALNVQRRF